MRSCGAAPPSRLGLLTRPRGRKLRMPGARRMQGRIHRRRGIRGHSRKGRLSTKTGRSKLTRCRSCDQSAAGARNAAAVHWNDVCCSLAAPGSASPLGQKHSGFFSLPADFTDCSGTVASASISHQQSMGAPRYAFDFYSDTGPSLAGRAQSHETQLQSFGSFGVGQSMAARTQCQDAPVPSAFGICSEAGQSLAGRAQAAAFEVRI